MVQTLHSKYLKILIAYPLLFSATIYSIFALDITSVAKVLEVPNIVLVLSLLPVLYCTLCFNYFKRKFGQKAAYITSIVSVFTPAVVAITFAGYGSLFYVANHALIMFLAPMLGIELPLALIGIHALGIILNSGGSMSIPGFAEYGILNFLIVSMSGLTGWLIFHRYYVKERVEVERMRRVLREEQLRSEALVASLVDGIIMIDKRGKVQICSKPALTMLGIKASDIISKQYLDVIKKLDLNLPPSKKAKVLKTFEQIISSKESIVIDPLVVKRANDHDSSISCSITPVIDDNGDVGALLLTLHDVSSYVHLQNLKDEFISTASHELRTPMTVIAGYSDLLLNPTFGELSEKQRHYVTRTKETTKQLIEMVNDMLDITKLESGQLENYPQTIDLESFSKNFISNLSEQLKEKNLIIKTTLSPAEIEVDKRRLELVYSNLLSNAIKFSNEDDTIKFKLENKRNNIEISVEDSGPGVPKELQKEIFTKFSRTKNTISANKSGTGLGLAIVTEIIKEWGGIINIESDGKNGSRFYFTIPHQSKDKENKK